MLRIKYIPDFKNNKPYLLITSTAEGFLNAAHFFRQRHSTVLNDPYITEINEMNGLRNPLLLTPSERVRLASIFERIANGRQPSHDYLDIQSLPNAEIIVSYGEYDHLFNE